MVRIVERPHEDPIIVSPKRLLYELPDRPEWVPEPVYQKPPKRKYAGPVTIACVLVPSKDFGVLDVVRLKNMVERNVSRKIRFVCLTTEPDWVFPEGIEVFPIRHTDWLSKQSKVEMFRPDILNDWGRVLYFDLDTVIVSNIDDILAYDGTLLMLADYCDPFGKYYGSGMMSWSPKLGSEIYERFASLDEETRNDVYRIGGGRSDQLAINHFTPVRPHTHKDVYPGRVVSYKAHCRGGIRPRFASVIVFHGRPKLREIDDEWILQHWK